jgi:chitin synthase
MAVSAVWRTHFMKLQLSCYERSRGKMSSFPSIGSNSFQVTHFGSTAEYESADFIDHNTDDIDPAILALFRTGIRGSTNKFLTEVFGKIDPATTSARADDLPKGYLMGKLHTSLSNISHAMESSTIWALFYVKNSSASLENFYSSYKNISSLTESVQHSFTFEAFKERYGGNDMFRSMDPKAPARQLCQYFVEACNSNDMVASIGKSFIYIDAKGFLYLEEAASDDYIIPSVKSANTVRASDFNMKAKSQPGVANWVQQTVGFEEKYEWEDSQSNTVPTEYTEIQPTPQVQKEVAKKPKEKMTAARCKWVCCTWCLTWWIPGFMLSWCGGMRSPQVRMAWREKVALCIIIFLLCSMLGFMIVGFGNDLLTLRKVDMPATICTQRIRGSQRSFKSCCVCLRASLRLEGDP